jgi:hypothetical protein
MFWERNGADLVVKTAVKITAVKMRAISKLNEMKNLFRRYQMRLEDVIKINIRSTIYQRQHETYSCFGYIHAPSHRSISVYVKE